VVLLDLNMPEWYGYADVSAGHFELGKIMSKEVRQRLVPEFFNKIDHYLAVRVANGVGIDPPGEFAGKENDKRAPEVSVKHRGRFDTIATRKIAILLADSFDHDQFMAVKQALAVSTCQWYWFRRCPEYGHHEHRTQSNQ
jgi:hypothetical protein